MITGDRSTAGAPSESGVGAPSSKATVVVVAAVLALAVGLALLTSFGASPASARPEGISGYSGNPEMGGNTCAVCHSANEPTPTVSISGPDTMAAGETAVFSFTVTDGPASVAGFNVSTTAAAGTLATEDPAVRVIGTELTHVAPKPTNNASATFNFTWTAPLESSTIVMWGAGVSGDGDFTNGGDSAAGTSKTITVVGEVPEVAVTAQCGDGGGELKFDLVNPFQTVSSYEFAITGLDPTTVSLFAGEAFSQTVTGVADGDPQVTVTRTPDIVVYDQPVTVDCGAGVDPIPGADGPIEVAHVVSCLAGNGRVDTNIVNTGVDAAAYRIEFQGLSPRQFTVPAGDWWRQPITGRPDADYTVVVKRAGVVVSDRTVTVSCDTDPPVIGADEIQILNACRAGNGYVLFQFLNSSDATKSYIIEFEGVNNRSTSTTAFGQTPRAVTGRPDGVYAVKIRSGFDTLAEFSVTVNCSQQV